MQIKWQLNYFLVLSFPREPVKFFLLLLDLLSAHSHENLDIGMQFSINPLKFYILIQEIDKLSHPDLRELRQSYVDLLYAYSFLDGGQRAANNTVDHDTVQKTSNFVSILSYENDGFVYGLIK